MFRNLIVSTYRMEGQVFIVCPRGAGENDYHGQTRRMRPQLRPIEFNNNNESVRCTLFFSFY